MSSKGTKLGKTIAAGIKRSVRESPVPISNLEGQIRVLTERGDSLVVYLNGVPPFTTVAIDDNGTVRTYLGHSELAPKEDPET